MLHYHQEKTEEKSSENLDERLELRHKGLQTRYEDYHMQQAM